VLDVAEVLIVPGPREAGEVVAAHIAGEVRRNPRLVLGVATGTTPLPVYGALRDHADAGLDFSRMRAFALDEYVGLPVDHPESYHAVIDREVRAPLGLDPARVAVPDGSAEGIETAGERYEAQLVDAGGIDIQLLGIGSTGHIGFNEPGSSFASLTRVKTLTEQTRIDNARFFASVDDVPVHCVTQGLGTILRARHLILLAFGSVKAEAVAAAVEGPVTASVPASAIQLHPHVTVVVDEGAASNFRFPDYYRWAQARKPVWQGL
jgi:glucosamine-6-phosphate deaminase